MTASLSRDHQNNLQRWSKTWPPVQLSRGKSNPASRIFALCLLSTSQWGSDSAEMMTRLVAYWRLKNTAGTRRYIFQVTGWSFLFLVVALFSIPNLHNEFSVHIQNGQLLFHHPCHHHQQKHNHCCYSRLYQHCCWIKKQFLFQYYMNNFALSPAWDYPAACIGHSQEETWLWC